METGTETTTPFHEEIIKFLAASDPARALNTLQEQILGAVRQSQDALLKVAHTWAETTANLVPQLPTSPLFAQAPGTVELVESTLKFVDGLLSAQKELVAGAFGPAASLVQAAQNGTDKP